MKILEALSDAYSNFKVIIKASILFPTCILFLKKLSHCIGGGHSYHLGTN